MKFCSICGVPDWDNNFEDGYCRECYLRNKRDTYKEKTIKKKNSKKKNDLEETCIKANKMGLTYAQYQIQETLGKIKDE